jgi:hypothetical protein
MPKSLFDKDGVKELVPEHAGIITVEKGDGYYRKLRQWVATIQREPTINRNARPINTEEKFQLARLSAMRIWNLKERLQKVREAMA